MARYAFRSMVIDEENITEEVNLLSKFCDEINEVYKEYLEILNGVKNEAIISGAAHDALEDFVNFAGDINGVFSLAGQIPATDKDTFFYDIDRADKYLY